VTGGVPINPGTVNVAVAPDGEWKPGGVQSTVPIAVSQVAFQSTPSFDGSPATVAAIVTVAPAGTELGGVWVIVTPVTVEMTVRVAELALLWSVVERALTVTVFLEGTARGAVKTVVAPLAVCEGEKDPQLGALPQLATQSTPACAMSLLTVAESCAMLPTIKVEGGACVMATEMMGVCVCKRLPFPGPVVQPAMARKMGRPTADNRNARTITLRENRSPLRPRVTKAFLVKPIGPSQIAPAPLPCIEFVSLYALSSDGATCHDGRTVLAESRKQTSVTISGLSIQISEVERRDPRPESEPLREGIGRLIVLKPP